MRPTGGMLNLVLKSNLRLEDGNRNAVLQQSPASQCARWDQIVEWMYPNGVLQLHAIVQPRWGRMSELQSTQGAFHDPGLCC